MAYINNPLLYVNLARIIQLTLQFTSISNLVKPSLIRFDQNICGAIIYFCCDGPDLNNNFTRHQFAISANRHRTIMNVTMRATALTCDKITHYII